MSKSIYLPKDDNSAFKVIGASTGIIIPLADFGYPNYHLTLYAKKTQDGQQTRINVHVTENVTNRRVYEKQYFLNDDFMSRLFQIKFRKMRRVVYKYRKIFRKNQLYSRHLACCSCAFETVMSAPNLNSRKGAEQLIPDIKRLAKKRLPLLPICNNPNHIAIYDLDSGQFGRKIMGQIITCELADEYTDSIKDVFKRELTAFETELDLMRSEINKQMAEALSE